MITALESNQTLFHVASNSSRLQFQPIKKTTTIAISRGVAVPVG
jgi:hypothetical protein